MQHPPLRLGRVGVLLVVLLIAGLVFIGGSALVDILFIRAPSDAQITAAIRAKIPEKYRNFVIGRIEPISSSPHSAEITVRSVSFSPTVLRFKAADFEDAAIKRGDDPTAFADAVARRSALDPRSAPPLPTDQPLKNLHVAATPAETNFAVEVHLRAEKVERNWPLRDCWLIWNGIRRWNFPEVNWPELPQAVATLRERQELGFNPALLGEKDTEAWFRAYIERRKAFIKAVHERENRSVDQVIQDAVRQWAEQSFKPSDAYVVKAVTPIRPKAVQAGSTVMAVSEASVVVEQQAELFRPGKLDAFRSAIAPLHDRLEHSTALAAEFLTEASLAAPVASAVYDSASPAGTAWTGTVAFEVRTSSTVSVENIRWTQEPKWPSDPLVSHRDTAPNAVFHSTESTLRTVARYKEEVEGYIKTVEQSIAAVESRWGKDRDAWRMALRALAAHGGRERIQRQVGFSEEVAGTRIGTDNKEYSFTGTRKTLMPFRFRDEFEFTSERILGTQIETLNERGFWRTGEGMMRADDAASVGKVTFQRRMAFTRDILWHLAADSTEQHTLVRGTDPNTFAVSTGHSDFPDVSITLDPEKGLITSARYEDPKAAGTKSVEARYSEFQTFSGTVRPTKVAILMDGKAKDTYTINAWREEPKIKPEDFRNPYSPGVPFRSNPNRPKHRVEVTNAAIVGTPIMICFDDDPDTVALASRGKRTILLHEGEHVMTIVAWIPQISLKQSHRIETTKARLTIRRPGDVVVSVDRNGNPPISWEFR